MLLTDEESDTVNDELRDRNRQLGSLNSDLDNLLLERQNRHRDTGGDLRLRRFNNQPRDFRSFRIPADVGRPITDITPHIIIPSLFGRTGFLRM